LAQCRPSGGLAEGDEGDADLAADGFAEQSQMTRRIPGDVRLAHGLEVG
jgi:hypothetical protein